MDNINKSDMMLCTNNAYLQYKDRHTNDMQFLQQMSNTRPLCLKNIEKESTLFLVESSKKMKTSSIINKRGITNCSEPRQICPNIYSKYSMQEFLVTPSREKNTYKNYLVMDKDCKPIILQHQMLNNWTKRKEITQNQNNQIIQDRR